MMNGFPIPLGAQTTAIRGEGTAIRAQKPELSPQEMLKAKEFETLFLSQFVDEMMKTVDLSAASGGRDMHMWRSFMSDALAQSLVDQGGLGLATSVEQMMSAYKAVTAGGNV